MTIVPTDRPDGEALKRAAHRLLESHREQLIRGARRALLSHLLEHDSATIDDVRAVVEVPDDINPKLFGAVPGPLVAERIIRPDGFVRTGRAVAHARPLTRWALSDRAAAERWLADHPAPTEPATVADEPADLFAI